MDSLKIYTQDDVLSLVNKRIGEEKLGEQVQVLSSWQNLAQSSAKFVLLGIPEDIGVRANHGIAGAKTAWQATLKAFLNIQSNLFLNGDEILVLGHFVIDEPEDISIQSLRNKTSIIDELVYPIIRNIVTAGKIPIVIGGGHNNALPLIWGTSLAYQQPINVINIDAHADLRDISEGRHSGNGFSNAIAQGLLNQYQIFGLHQNYMNSKLMEQIAGNTSIKVSYYEDLLLNERSIESNWLEAVAPIPNPCGLELDLDSIANILSSATSATAFKLDDIRKILLSTSRSFCYLHICEGAIKLQDGREDLTTGKTIAYLISDFIKALQPRIYQQL